MYEFRCDACGKYETVIRRVSERNTPRTCKCSTEMVRLISTPIMHVWEAGRYFPNVRPEGDGAMTFPSRAAYEAHLKEKGMAEVSTDAPVKRPHGNKVVMKF
jgi:putative FmdB family regulatory protein